MSKYFKLTLLVFALAGCSSTSTKSDSETKGDSTIKTQALLKESSDENISPDQPSQSDDDFFANSNSVKKDTSAAEASFKTAMNSTREDLLIQSGSEILTQKPDDLNTLNGFAHFYIHANLPDLARIYLNRVIAKDPKNADANNSLGVLAMRDKKEADAQVFFKRSLQGDSNQASANANLGAFYLKYLDYDKAAMFLEKAYDNDHKNVAVANNYAIALRGLGKYDEAMSIYKSIESKAKPQVLLNEAILLSEYKKDFKEAKDILNKIRFISSDPEIIKKVDFLKNQMGQQKND